MDHVQDRCHKKEGEFDRLGDTGNAGSQHNGHQDGFNTLFVFGASRLIHSQSSAGQAEDLGNAAALEDRSSRKGSHIGAGQFGQGNVAGPLDQDAIDHSTAAQRGVEDHRVQDVVQTNGDQQPFRSTKEEVAQVTGFTNDRAELGDHALDWRPNMGADDRKKDGNRNHDDEHETCTTVDLERTLEFGVDKAVVHRGHHKAQDNTQEGTHFQHLHAQNNGLTCTAQCIRRGQQAAQIHVLVHRVQEHNVGQHTDERGIRLFLFRQANRNANCEDQTQIAQNWLHAAG